MSLYFYILTSLFVFFFSGLMAMAGLGAALLFVPFFYYMGVPLGEAVPTALLLNAVSLSVASINYFRNKLINWRLGLPILIAAVALSPLGARLTLHVNKELLLGLFAAFLLFAGGMMLFYQPRQRERTLDTGAAKVEPKPDFTFSPVKGSFNKTKCSACGEYVFDRYLRMKDSLPICIPCSAY